METAALFDDDTGQTVRLPPGFHLPGDRVRVHRLGDALILAPEDGPYSPFLDSLAHFADDFMVEPEDAPPGEARDQRPAPPPAVAARVKRPRPR